MGWMKPPYTTCVVHDVEVVIIDPNFDKFPKPPKDIEADLPIWAVVELAKDPDDEVALDNVRECLRFVLGFMGFSYCGIRCFGAITQKGQQ